MLRTRKGLLKADLRGRRWKSQTALIAPPGPPARPPPFSGFGCWGLYETGERNHKIMLTFFQKKKIDPTYEKFHVDDRQHFAYSHI